jgi:hypothetical protein
MNTLLPIEPANSYPANQYVSRIQWGTNFIVVDSNSPPQNLSQVS